ncbi:hypothetical protein [Aminobacter sp. AP02]|uniref:hypothetical protein n=1 Tax=Aminobacter sp. AP02 TaxID=2135737 RepID=UPI000D79BBEC|nr:hypothetical protein [Aminobacter sp. AP02]PWK72586.1 hypothetical protein C8K44_10526 [Aminobacter sp. AP02]
MRTARLCRDQFEFVDRLLFLDELLLVDVLVLVDEFVPESLFESLSEEQVPFEQLVELALDVLVDFDTPLDLLPIRMRSAPPELDRKVRSNGADATGAAPASENVIAVPRMPAAKATVPRLAMAMCSFPTNCLEVAANRALDHSPMEP